MSQLYFVKKKQGGRQDETKQPSPPPSTESTTTLTTTSNMYLSTHLIIPYFITASGEIKRPEHLIACGDHASFLFYASLTIKIVLNYVFLCRLFRDSLKQLFAVHETTQEGCGSLAWVVEEKVNARKYKLLNFQEHNDLVLGAGKTEYVFPSTSRRHRHCS